MMDDGMRKDVYNPSQAKYSPIFSPKYFLEKERNTTYIKEFPVAQWVKDSALSLLRLWLRLGHRFDPWPGELLHATRARPKEINKVVTTFERACVSFALITVIR